MIVDGRVERGEIGVSPNKRREFFDNPRMHTNNPNRRGDINHVYNRAGENWSEGYSSHNYNDISFCNHSLIDSYLDPSYDMDRRYHVNHITVLINDAFPCFSLEDHTPDYYMYPYVNDLGEQLSSLSGSVDSNTLENKQPSKKTPRKKNGGLFPGKTNPDVVPGERLCYEFLQSGKCSRQMEGQKCRYRHLISTHPEAIAYRYSKGLLTEEEIVNYQLRPCEEHETNPFAPINAPLCKDFLNHKYCQRTRNMKICRYRHCLPQHPLAIKDKEQRKMKVSSHIRKNKH